MSGGSWFQFQTGAIKRQAYWHASAEGRGFNSKLVRLKARPSRQLQLS